MVAVHGAPRLPGGGPHDPVRQYALSQFSLLEHGLPSGAGQALERHANVELAALQQKPLVQSVATGMQRHRSDRFA